MIEIVAIFVACQMNLLICIDLPFVKKYHTFENPNDCRLYVAMIVKNEQTFRIENKISYPIIMGKCKYYVNENQ